MQIINKELIALGYGADKALNDSQFLLLDIEKEEDIQASLGRCISDARAEIFILLSDIKDKTIRDKIISNYKSVQSFRKKEDLFVENSTSRTSTKMPDQIAIYCDGGCNPNPGKAGSGVAIYKDDQLDELWYGLSEEHGTNNTAELHALYHSPMIAKNSINKIKNISIRCDSMYSINCIKTWAISWEKNGWKRKGGEIKNLEIIKQSYYLYHEIKNNISLQHIKAHSGLEGNELADSMTMYAIDQKERSFMRYDKKIDIDKLNKMRVG